PGERAARRVEHFPSSTVFVSRLPRPAGAKPQLRADARLPSRLDHADTRPSDARADLYLQCLVEFLRRAGRETLAGALLPAGRGDASGCGSRCCTGLLTVEEPLWQRPRYCGQVD